MMRIAYVSMDPGIPVWGMKGASIHVQEMVRAMTRLGASVTVFTPRPEGPALAPTVALPLAAGPCRATALCAADDALGAVLAAHGPFDLVYERHALHACGAMEWAAASGTPSVSEINAPLIEEQTAHRSLPLPDEALARSRRALRAAGAVIAVSAPVAAYARSHGASRVEVIANAVDPDRFALPREAGRRFTVGFTGSLRPWHDLNTLGLAMALVPEAHFLIVGDGPELARLAPVLDRAEVTGMVPPAEVPRWLARMDVAVAPYSARQPFYFSPLKVHEYMAAGLPVIASRIGDLDRSVRHGETGLIVAPDDPDALAAAIRRLQADPALGIRLGENGRAHVCANHTWQGVARRVLELARVAA